MRRHRRRPWLRTLRRGLALCMAVPAVWLVAATADLDGAAQAVAALGSRPDFAAAALELELGAAAAPEDALSGLGLLQRLVVGQSPLLLAGRAGVTQALSGADGGVDQSAAPAEDPAPSAGAAEQVQEQTLGVSDGQYYDSAEGIYVNNPTGQQVDVAALAAAPITLTLPEEGPQILIMHTHGSEAYTPDGDDVYQASDDYRTTDPDYNMIRVGEEMARVLEEAGFSVLHDTTLYDYPSYNDAYDRALAGVEAALAEHPTIRVVLDVHRDALTGEDGTVYRTAAQLEGVQSAQVMLVMGSNSNGLPHDNWRENLTLAVHLQGRLNRDWPTLARPISLRSGRYNQQLTTGSLLVEVGSHGNTLQEALTAARLFAQSAAQVLEELKQ